MLDWRLYIESVPEKLYGKPVIVNTRLSVDLILEKLGYGENIDEILDAYPVLSRNDILACLLFASDAIKNEIVFSKAS